MTQNNLGTALADLGQRTRDTSEICQALSDYVSAWQVFSGAAPYDASIAAGGAKQMWTQSIPSLREAHPSVCKPIQQS
jgi:hypothetical protein